MICYELCFRQVLSVHLDESLLCFCLFLTVNVAVVTTQISHEGSIKYVWSIIIIYAVRTIVESVWHIQCLQQNTECATSVIRKHKPLPTTFQWSTEEGEEIKNPPPLPPHLASPSALLDKCEFTPLDKCEFTLYFQINFNYQSEWMCDIIR